VCAPPVGDAGLDGVSIQTPRSTSNSNQEAHVSAILLVRSFPRKEVIQPHLPVRLPCYDFTPVT